MNIRIKIQNTEVKEESDNYTLRDQVANGTIYRKRDFKLNTGETIEVHEYPLLYLGDLSSGIGAAGYSAYYARRVEWRYCCVRVG